MTDAPENPPSSTTPAPAPYWYTTEEIAQVVKRNLDESSAQALRWLKEGVNFLKHAKEHDDLERCLVEPTTSIDERWDTMIAACIRYRLRKLGVDAPAWTYKPPLDLMWFPAGMTRLRVTNAINLAPVELRRVGILYPEPALDY